MKKIMFLTAGLLISAVGMFGQELPLLHISEKDMSRMVAIDMSDNETLVEIQSLLPLTFNSTVDQRISFYNTTHENGFYIYQLVFPTATEAKPKAYKGRRLKIQTIGFDTYTQSLDLKAKNPVKYIVTRMADFYYDQRNYDEALREYEKILVFNPNDDNVRRRIEEIKGGGGGVAQKDAVQDVPVVFSFKGLKKKLSAKLYLDDQLIGEINSAKNFQLRYSDKNPGLQQLRIVWNKTIPEWSGVIDTKKQTEFKFEHKKTGFGYEFVRVK